MASELAPGARTYAVRSSKNGANGTAAAGSSRILNRRPSVDKNTASMSAAGSTVIRARSSARSSVTNVVSLTYSPGGDGAIVWYVPLLATTTSVSPTCPTHAKFGVRMTTASVVA